mgnify:CR=1 FL=1
MIIGHGIDLVEIDRVNNIYAKYKKNFISKYFLNDQFKSINTLSLIHISEPTRPT